MDTRAQPQTQKDDWNAHLFEQSIFTLKPGTTRIAIESEIEESFLKMEASLIQASGDAEGFNGMHPHHQYAYFCNLLEQVEKARWLFAKIAGKAEGASEIVC
jgi:hypothetical protein